MIYVNRMIGRLMQLMQDADLALSHSRSRKDGHAELVFVDGLRSAEGKENATGCNRLECLDIKFGISA